MAEDQDLNPIPAGASEGLYIVSLPIGNLSDITLRAIETLRHVEYILAEDTRTTRRVLDRYRIETPFYSSLYQGVEEQRIQGVLRLLERGGRIALVSDAGTPLISDPGYPLVRAVIDAGIPVHPIPGASAVLAAVVASGLPTAQFVFAGSLPRKRGAREALFRSLVLETRTVIAYESPHRMLDTLVLLSRALPSRTVVLARELTKIHEEFLRGTAGALHRDLSARESVRGEFVLAIQGAEPSAAARREEDPRLLGLIAALRNEGLSDTSIRRVLTEGLGIRRNDAYERVRKPDR